MFLAERDLENLTRNALVSGTPSMKYDAEALYCTYLHNLVVFLRNLGKRRTFFNS